MRAHVREKEREGERREWLTSGVERRCQGRVGILRGRGLQQRLELFSAVVELLPQPADLFLLQSQRSATLRLANAELHIVRLKRSK
jgi:hypothetical protein